MGSQERGMEVGDDLLTVLNCSGAWLGTEKEELSTQLKIPW